MSLPALNPLEAPAVICPSCGELINPEPVHVGKARITEVRYMCVNEAKGCSWQLTATLRHINGQDMKNIKPEELDKLRKDAAVLKDRKQKREDGVSTLLAMLPALQEITKAHRSHGEAKTPPPAGEKTKAKPPAKAGAEATA